MISKPLLVGGAVLAGALLWMFSGTSHAAVQTEQKPIPRPPDLPPPAPPPNVAPTTIAPVVVHGDPAAIAWGDATLTAAIDCEHALATGAGAGCTFADAVHNFQAAYNADPTSQHPENVLGSAAAPRYNLDVDGLYGQQTATALMYVTGDFVPSLC